MFFSQLAWGWGHCGRIETPVEAPNTPATVFLFYTRETTGRGATGRDVRLYMTHEISRSGFGWVRRKTRVFARWYKVVSVLRVTAPV